MIPRQQLLEELLVPLYSLFGSEVRHGRAMLAGDLVVFTDVDVCWWQRLGTPVLRNQEREKPKCGDLPPKER